MLHCCPLEMTHPGMTHHRDSLQQQPQRLPMNCSYHLGRHPGKSQDCAVQLSSRPLAPFQLQRGIEDLTPAFITDALTDKVLAGRRERPIVFVSEFQKRRNVEYLRKSVPLIFTGGALHRRSEPIVRGFSEGVVHLGHDHLQFVFPVVAVKKRNGIEVVSQVAEMSEQEYFPFGKNNAVFSRIPRYALPQSP